MTAFWYGVVTFTLAMYVTLDGRNFGVGILQFVVARDRAERRQVTAALGPLWPWHEVWLVAFGGVLFAAFPRLLAAAFSGYYLALFLILWCGILRGMALELAGHIEEPLWQGFWDAVLFGSSALLAVLFGAALGNVLRGVPIRPDGTFHMAFFSDFTLRGDVGLLDGYTLAVALFAAAVLTAHGATYLAHETQGPVHDRSVAVARVLWVALVPAFGVVSYLTARVRPELFAGLARHPLAWLGAGLCVASAAVLALGIFKKDDERALLGASALLPAVIGTGAAALYPTFLFSTLDPSKALTAATEAAPHEGLVIASTWWPIAAVLAFAYAFAVRRYYRDREKAEDPPATISG